MKKAITNADSHCKYDTSVRFFLVHCLDIISCDVRTNQLMNEILDMSKSLQYGKSISGAA